jgi:hypothetical protein
VVFTASPTNQVEVGGPPGYEATHDELTRFVREDRHWSVTSGFVWGFFNPNVVAEHGYQPPEPMLVVGMYIGEDADPVRDACISRVNSVIPGGDITYLFTVSSLPDGGSQWKPDDSRILAVEQQWSACMADRGFQYATPIDAINSHYMNPSTPEAISVAVADIQCKLETNLVGVVVAVQSAYDQQYIDAHRDKLVAVQNQISDFIAGRTLIPDKAPPTTEPSMAES